MFCPNCGKELNEGEVCTCTKNPEEISENSPVQDTAEVSEQAKPAQEYNNPSAQQQAYYNPEVNNSNVFTGAFYDPSQAYNNANGSEEKVPARTDYPEGYKIKKKYVAVILAFCLGSLGIHNFYLGNKERALAQVLIATIGSVFTLGLAAIGVSVWATVEAVLLLTENIDRDANGYKIQTFEEAIAKEMKKD